ncbi:hypothetical protein FKP32DRAFT_1093514 [Trametes sanguinea]|nr:hypothetical protein FKP32DRAFT_1093514 [Trametes sanguinea]
MAGLGFDIWGAVAAAISIAALVPPIAYYFLGGFPTSNLRALEELLNETEKMFQDCIKEGVIHREDDLRGLHTWLWKIKSRADVLRLGVYDIRTWRDELAKWRAGLTCQICILYGDISKLRLKLARTSSRERRALEVAGHPSRLVYLSAIQSRASHSVSPHTLPPASLTFGDGIRAMSGASSIPEHPAQTETVQVTIPSETSPPSNPVPYCPGLPSTGQSHPHMHPGCHYVCDCSQVGHGDSVLHLVPDSDLNSLFSLALSSPQCRPGSSTRPHRDKRRRRAIYQELLSQYGRRLFGADSTIVTERGPPPSRRSLGLRSRLKELSRLMQRYRPSADLGETVGHRADACGSSPPAPDQRDPRINESDHILHSV